MAEKYDGLNIQIGYPEKSMDEEEKYVLTPWGCLMGVLMDYGINTIHITPKVGEHMVAEFMQSMEKAGYIKGKEDAQPEQECEKCIFRPFKQFQSEPHWIPCSERLPDDEVRKLVELDNGWMVSAWCDGESWYAVPPMYDEFDSICSLEDNGYHVTAWMPLPEPWRGEDG